MEIPDNLLCLFTARIDHQNGAYTITVPAHELETGELDAGATYRVAILSAGSTEWSPDSSQIEREPPVQEGDVRTVEIEGIGDQGDGIARVDRGYVVIVPDTNVGDVVDVEIEETRPNFAIARILDDQPTNDFL